MKKLDIEKASSHELLAFIGKKVLRPGGKKLTNKLIASLNISKEDNVVEFAPGLGYTARVALKNHPKSYTGIDNSDEKIHFLKNKFNDKNTKFVVGSVEHTDLESESKDKVYGEAILSMHADHRKEAIIKEAHRILKRGGLYAIHELELTPDNLSDEKKAEIQKDLAIAAKVNARPMTESEWINLIKKCGFDILNIEHNSMMVLKLARIIDDEGIFRAIKIISKILTHPKARKRVLKLRKVFKKHREYMSALIILAQRN